MGEFLETTFEKFIFKVKVGYLYSKEEFWANIQDGVATIGLTDFMQKAKGDVAFLEIVEPGAEVKQGGEIGKKLDFLLQEMNREINTIGSKSNNAEIARQVIEAKSELGKLREQAQNIE